MASVPTWHYVMATDMRNLSHTHGKSRCQVEWVEVEVEAGQEPRPWRELKQLLLSSLEEVRCC